MIQIYDNLAPDHDRHEIPLFFVNNILGKIYIGEVGNNILLFQQSYTFHSITAKNKTTAVNVTQ